MTGIAPGGWMPYAERNFAQQMMTDSWRHATPRFGEVGGDVNLPEQALLYDLEVKANGKLCSRIWQQEGSCVGAAGARSYTQSMCGDKIHRNTGEEIKDLCPWPTWGIGRKIGGLNSRGAGSFGAAQAKAVESWGMLPADDPRLPQPTNRDGWLVWSSKIELDFSAPRYWPVPESELAPTADDHQIAHVARITTLDELWQAFAQGYGVTCASMFGTKAKVRGGYLVGEWTTNWAHQMSWSGYVTIKRATSELPAGKLIAVDNQWGPQAHVCPTLQQRGVLGSFWITEATAKKILGRRDTEVFAHGNTEDFPAREIDWDDLGMG